MSTWEHARKTRSRVRTAIAESIDIARPPAEVFTYATDFARFPEWQGGVLAVRPATSAPLTVGSTAQVTRRVGPRALATTELVTELTPPRRWVVRGSSGLPVIAVASGSIEPLAHGARSRVTISLDFEAHGVGRLLLPFLVRRIARPALRQNVMRLQAALEGSQVQVNGRRLPRWVPFVNRIARPLVALGVPLGPEVLLTVRGRKTGLPRTTPVALCENAGRRGLISPFGESDWARNLRAAGRATITRGRSTEEVAAVELGPTDAVAFICAVLAPHARRSRFGHWFVRHIDKIDLDHPEEAAVGRPVFELFPVDQRERSGVP